MSTVTTFVTPGPNGLPVSITTFPAQSEDGIRGHCVTGVQTCALPILLVLNPTSSCFMVPALVMTKVTFPVGATSWESEIGRASCRERVKVARAGVEPAGETQKSWCIQAW